MTDSLASRSNVLSYVVFDVQLTSDPAHRGHLFSSTRPAVESWRKMGEQQARQEHSYPSSSSPHPSNKVSLPHSLICLWLPFQIFLFTTLSSLALPDHSWAETLPPPSVILKAGLASPSEASFPVSVFLSQRIACHASPLPLLGGRGGLKPPRPHSSSCAGRRGGLTSSSLLC